MLIIIYYWKQYFIAYKSKSKYFVKKLLSKEIHWITLILNRLSSVKYERIFPNFGMVSTRACLLKHEGCWRSLWSYLGQQDFETLTWTRTNQECLVKLHQKTRYVYISLTVFYILFIEHYLEIGMRGEAMDSGLRS